MNIEIKEMPEFSVASVRHIGPYNEIGKAFERLFKWIGENNINPATEAVMGIYWDDPMKVAPSELRSDASITVKESYSLPEDMFLQKIPAGKYAVYHAVIKMEEFEKAWMDLFNWIFQNQQIPDERPCYEIYLNDGTSDPEGKWIVDICAGIK